MVDKRWGCVLHRIQVQLSFDDLALVLLSLPLGSRLVPEIGDQCWVSTPQGLEEFLWLTFCNHHRKLHGAGSNQALAEEPPSVFSTDVCHMSGTAPWHTQLHICNLISPNPNLSPLPFIFFCAEVLPVLQLYLLAFAALKPVGKSGRGKIIFVTPLHCITVYFFPLVSGFHGWECNLK